MSAIVETDWAEIYTDYYEKIYSYFMRRVRNPEICEELTSETFIKAIESTERGVGANSHFNGWLYRIAHNLTIDHYRLRDRREEISIDSVAEITASVDDMTEQTEIKIAFEGACSAIARLTDDQQRVLVMYFLDGYDFDEIADSLGKNRDAVKALLFRALTAANKLLGGNGRPGKIRGKWHEVEKLLRLNGPMTIDEIRGLTKFNNHQIRGSLYNYPRVFVKVGSVPYGRVIAYVWGLVGVHDKKAESI